MDTLCILGPGITVYLFNWLKQRSSQRRIFLVTICRIATKILIFQPLFIYLSAEIINTGLNNQSRNHTE